MTGKPFSGLCPDIRACSASGLDRLSCAKPLSAKAGRDVVEYLSASQGPGVWALQPDSPLKQAREAHIDATSIRPNCLAGCWNSERYAGCVSLFLCRLEFESVVALHTQRSVRICSPSRVSYLQRPNGASCMQSARKKDRQRALAICTHCHSSCSSPPLFELHTVMR